MAASGHFLFELVKIAILSICYSGLMMLIGRMLFGRGYLKFGRLFCNIYAALFIFMFTYYGDHGLGDESNLPIGHWKIVKASDGYPYFEPAGNKRQIQLKSFLVNKETLCAQTGEGYMAYDLVTDKLSTFLNQSNYDSYAAINGFPSSQSFKLFSDYYKAYWDGWRFWIMP